MAFDKMFFDKLPELIKLYIGTYHTGTLSVVITTTDDNSYTAVKTLEISDRWVTFSYYSVLSKSRELPGKIQETYGEIRAWPAVTLPYETILRVELIPGAPETLKTSFGFQSS